MRNELIKLRSASPFRIFEEFERDFENVWARPSQAQFFAPAVDIEENDNGYYLSFDVPGVAREDIHLELKDGMIKVWGERKKEIKQGKYSEKSYGRFERAFSLPEVADSENIEANFQDGVLNVLVPKKQVTQAKRIEVKEGKGNFFKKLLGSHSKEDKH